MRRLAVCGDRATWADVAPGQGHGVHQYVYDVYDVSTGDLVSADVPRNVGLSSCEDNLILWEAFDDDNMMVAALTEW